MVSNSGTTEREAIPSAETRPTSFRISASSSKSDTLSVFEMIEVRIAPGP